MIYSVLILEQKPGETSVCRNPETAKNGLVNTVNDYKNLKDLIIGSKEKYAKLNLLGTKSRSIAGLRGVKKWIANKAIV
jgi:hypothetical protein